MLTQDQIDHFNTLGFLVIRQAFTPQEIETFIREAESVCTKLLGHPPGEDDKVWEQPFVEYNPTLTQLVQDDRIYAPVHDLLGEKFVWIGSEGMWGFTRKMVDHHWHADGNWSEQQLDYTWLKVMLYLDPLQKDAGALRVMPGSHRPVFHESLKPLYDASRYSSPRYFGMDGADVPSYVIETEPGDVVLFNVWIFHSVYRKKGLRRTLVLKFVPWPTTDAQLTALARSQHTFAPHESFLNSDSPRIRGMIDGLPVLRERIVPPLSVDKG